ncbi:hypothetical protein [Aquimarina spinulae]|uniref:hypothetical protein n=1 Tax=Aquimarina spinulae TaxID=1192023 RepID=UPI000D55EE87|nr:hypothetical protein [Aquimarina spinulae]
MALKFYENLEIKLYKAKKNNLLELGFRYMIPMEKKSLLSRLSMFDKSFQEMYNKTNGLEINWKANNIEQAYGNLEFIDFETIVGSWEGQVFERDDLEFNELLEFYHPFDNVSPEFSCGFIIDNETGTWESIYTHTWGERSTKSLDINFEGYITMLYESRAYKNWPLILLDIQYESFESDLIKDFKSHMPQLFPDFDWNNYLEKYNSLRLSKNK